MPKQPLQTIDRFRIVIADDVPATELGMMLAQLARAGLQNIGYELITDVLTYKKNGSMAARGDAHTLATAFVKKHATFRFRDIASFFVENGLGKTSASGPLKKMTEDGSLVALGGGNYQRSDVKAIAGPKTKKAKGVKATEKKKGSGVDLVRSYIKTRKTVNTTQLKELYRADSRPPSSVHQTINFLRGKGELKHIGEPGSGQYEVVTKAVRAHMNGGNAAQVEVPAHG